MSIYRLPYFFPSSCSQYLETYFVKLLAFFFFMGAKTFEITCNLASQVTLYKMLIEC